MKNQFFFSLATAFVALALFVLISCGTMGDGGGNGGEPNSNSSGNWSPMYCDYGPITQYGGGCFEMENENDCDTEWGQVVSVCGNYPTPSSNSGGNWSPMYCDYGPILQIGGYCFEMEDENDCDEYGQVVSVCGNYPMPSSSSNQQPPRSSSSVAQMVYCKLIDGRCFQESYSVCMLIINQGQGVAEIVSSCNSSSSGGSTQTTFTDTRDNKVYKTVVIGTQTWMAENLNYNASGSKCYNNLESNCNIYGRLYDWSTAMNFASSCNSNSCSSQIQTKHKGVCPSGWHIPSDAEWDVLFTFAGGSSVAGKKLKANSRWNGSGGTDQYGFSALPGGGGSSDGGFNGTGSYGSWRSASELDNGNDYNWYMFYNDENVNIGSNGKPYLYSVRCLKD